MNNPRISKLDMMIFAVSICALVGAFVLAMSYVNNTNPDSVPFLLRPDTYGKVLPFLLGTVVAGGFALAYQKSLQLKEARSAKRKAEKALLDQRIRRLQELYDIALTLFQRIRLQRRRMRIALVPGATDGTWRLRRQVFEEVCAALNVSQLAGERIVRTLDFDAASLQGILDQTEDQSILLKLQSDLKSQIGGLQGILRNVLRTAELSGATTNADSPEALVEVPSGLIKFSESGSSGNLGFRKISEHYDAFAKQILGRLRQLEAESNSLAEE
jgi:hypothetical protein